MRTPAPCVALTPALVLAATPGLAHAADVASGADGLREILTTVLALVAVCVIAFVCLFTLRRFQVGAGDPVGGAGELRFLRALPIGTRERLVVVRWRGRTLLLGVTQGSIAVLDSDGGSDSAPPVDGRADAGLPPAELATTLLARVFAARRARKNPS